MGTWAGWATGERVGDYRGLIMLRKRDTASAVVEVEDSREGGAPARKEEGTPVLEWDRAALAEAQTEADDEEGWALPADAESLEDSFGIEVEWIEPHQGLGPRAKSNADANDEPTRSSAKPAAAEAMRRILIDNAWRKMHCKGNPSARGPLARFQRSINKPGWICPSARAILTVFASGRDLGVVGKDNSLGYRL